MARTAGERFYDRSQPNVISILYAAVEIYIESSLKKKEWQVCTPFPTLTTLGWLSLKPTDWVQVLDCCICSLCICLRSNHFGGSSGAHAKMSFSKFRNNAEWKGQYSSVQEKGRSVLPPKWSQVWQYRTEQVMMIICKFNNM